jgi:hypothetical protein
LIIIDDESNIAFVAPEENIAMRACQSIGILALLFF